MVISLYRAVWPGGLFLKGMSLSTWELSIRKKRTHLAVNSISSSQSCLFNEMDLDFIRFSTKTELWIRIVPPFQENAVSLLRVCFNAHSIHAVFLFVSVMFCNCNLWMLNDTARAFIYWPLLSEAVRLLRFFSTQLQPSESFNHMRSAKTPCACVQSVNDLLTQITKSSAFFSSNWYSDRISVCFTH